MDFSATARMVRYQDRGLEPAIAGMGAKGPFFHGMEDCFWVAFPASLCCGRAFSCLKQDLLKARSLLR